LLPGHCSRGTKAEEPKVILGQSFLDALARYFYHFIPCAGSIALTVLNVRVHYFGAGLKGLGGREHGSSYVVAWIQIFAKIQVSLKFHTG
jgi:hypothetical protein